MAMIEAYYNTTIKSGAFIMKKIIMLLIAGITAGAAWCCMPPSNMEGVAFTSRESLDLTKFTTLGTDGIHFKRDSTEAGIAVRYRSHYSDNAMVFVGMYGLTYQQSLRLNCMGIIADTDRFGSGSIDKKTFDFAQAVRIELTWMLEQGIVAIDKETIVAIFDSLNKSSNGGVQYWTLQKHVLGYNSWYEKDTETGVWGTDNINGVRSVKSAACSGINAEYKAFTRSLDQVLIKNMPAQSVSTFHITRSTNTSLTITPWNNIDKVNIVDMSGKICPVRTTATTSGIMVSFNTQIVPGIYFLKLTRDASVQTVPVLIGR